jgi:hypothetical protein
MVYILVFALIPLNTFSFRTWESLIWRKGEFGAFYPNKTTIMNEGGDLGHGTKFGVIKENIIWITDKHGFRNNQNTSAKYDILLVGDSFSVGSGTSQENILSNQISNILKIPVYNYSPRTITNYFFTELTDMDIKPKLVIYQVIERNIPTIPIINFYSGYSVRHGIKTRIKKLLYGNQSISFVLEAIDRFKKNEPIRFIQSRIDAAFGASPISVIIGVDNELFMNSEYFRNYSINDDEILEIANTLKKISDSFQEMGIEFIFLPVPNKATIYFELLPENIKNKFNNRFFLAKLKTALDLKGVKSIDTYSSFRSHFLAGERLYFSDDTHWNKLGINLTAEMISLMISNDMKITR